MFETSSKGLDPGISPRELVDPSQNLCFVLFSFSVLNCDKRFKRCYLYTMITKTLFSLFKNFMSFIIYDGPRCRNRGSTELKRFIK